MFNSMQLALSARDFMRGLNPFIVRIDALGAGTVAADDELVILVRPNNALAWSKVSLACTWPDLTFQDTAKVLLMVASAEAVARL